MSKFGVLILVTIALRYSFNRWLAECIFLKQTQEELDSGQGNREWVAILPIIFTDKNKTVTWMTGLPPENAVKMCRVP